MRQVLRLIGNRYGAALLLVFVIAVVVGFGKLLGGANHAANTYEPGPATATTELPQARPTVGMSTPWSWVQ